MDIKDLKPNSPDNKTIVKGGDFPAMLVKWKAEIANALPKHLNPDRMARIALTAFRRTPRLAECDPRSVFAAVIQASQLGLEPDTLGRAYLVPYKVNKKLANGQWESHMECQFIPGWKGLAELMNRSGQGTAWTGAVYQGDAFEFALGDSPRVHHIPAGEYADEKLHHVYAVGRLRGCEWPIVEVWTMDRVSKHRDRYNKVGDRHYSFENMEMYARKIVLLQVLKYLPLSADLIRTMELSNAAESDAGQGLTLEGVIDGSWTPPGQEAREPEPEPEADDTGQWPKLLGDGRWVDAAGAQFQSALHGWDREASRPSTTDKGIFRAKRGVAKDGSPPAQPKTPASPIEDEDESFRGL